MLHDLENGSSSTTFSAIFSENKPSFVKNIMDVVSEILSSEKLFYIDYWIDYA